MALSEETKKHLIEGGLILGAGAALYFILTRGGGGGGAIETIPPIGGGYATPAQPSALTVNYPPGSYGQSIPGVGQVATGAPSIGGVNLGGSNSGVYLGAGSQCGCCYGNSAQGNAIPAQPLAQIVGVVDTMNGVYAYTNTGAVIPPAFSSGLYPGSYINAQQAAYFLPGGLFYDYPSHAPQGGDVNGVNISAGFP